MNINYTDVEAEFEVLHKNKWVKLAISKVIPIRDDVVFAYDQNEKASILSRDNPELVSLDCRNPIVTPHRDAFDCIVTSYEKPWGYVQGYTVTRKDILTGNEKAEFFISNLPSFKLTASNGIAFYDEQQNPYFVLNSMDANKDPSLKDRRCILAGSVSGYTQVHNAGNDATAQQCIDNVYWNTISGLHLRPANSNQQAPVGVRPSDEELRTMLGNKLRPLF